MDVRRALRDLDRHVLPSIAGFLRVGRHRRRRPMVGGVALLTSVGLAAGLAWLVSAKPSEPPTGHARVGVRAGQSVPGYVTDARRALDGLRRSDRSDRPVYALASFERYLAPGRLARLLAGVRTERVYTRVPSAAAAGPVAELPAHRVPADVRSGMDRLAADRGRLADDFGRLAASPGTGTDQRSQYRQERTAYRTEATAYRRHCSCVFAAVVRAGAADLVGLADRRLVRAVDPAPALRSLTGAVFTPPLPEQTGAAVPPEAQSPVPSTSPTPSTGPTWSAPPSTAPSASPSGTPPSPSQRPTSRVPSSGPTASSGSPADAAPPDRPPAD